MGIVSRFTRERDVTQRYSLPSPIYDLFQTLPAFGTVFDRKIFFHKNLPRHETFTVECSGFKFGGRPTWMPYYHGQRTHIIIAGHVLFIYVKDDLWAAQPSVRLFEETPMARQIGFHQLLSVGKKCRPAS